MKMVMAHVWGTPTDTEITPIAYRVQDTLYMYDRRAGRPIWWQGYWIIDLAADYERENPDEDATTLTIPHSEEWETTVNRELAHYGLTLGTFHDWNEYELIEL